MMLWQPPHFWALAQKYKLDYKKAGVPVMPVALGAKFTNIMILLYSKLHFYITGVTFYNFPYTFGYLLSRGLFAMFKKEGAHFLPKYEEFLRLTGSDTAENVAKRSIGHDLESPEFWVESIHTLKEPLNKLKQLLQKIQ